MVGCIPYPGHEHTRDSPSVTGIEPPTRVVGDEHARQAEYARGGCHLASAKPRNCMLYESFSCCAMVSCFSTVHAFQIPVQVHVPRRPSTSVSPRLTVKANNNADHGTPWLPVAMAASLLLAPNLPPLPPSIAHAQTMAIEQSTVSTTTTTTPTSTSTSTTVSFQPSPSAFTLNTPRTGPIMDLSHVLSKQDQVDILRRIQQAETKTGTEIQIVISNQIDPTRTPKQLATALFNQWKIGSADRNNGVLILAVLDQRRVEIEVGKGIGKSNLMNAQWCTATLQEVAVPQFRQGNYGRGILDTVDRVAQRLEDVMVASTTTITRTQTKQVKPRTLVLPNIVLCGGILAGAVSAQQAQIRIHNKRVQERRNRMPEFSSKPKPELRRNIGTEARNPSSLRSITDLKNDIARSQRKVEAEYQKATRRQRNTQRITRKNTSTYDYDGGSSWGSSSSGSGGGSSDGDGGGADW